MSNTQKLELRKKEQFQIFFSNLLCLCAPFARWKGI